MHNAQKSAEWNIHFNLHVEEASLTNFSIASTLFPIGPACVDSVYKWNEHLRKRLLNNKEDALARWPKNMWAFIQNFAGLLEYSTLTFNSMTYNASHCYFNDRAYSDIL